MNETTVFPLLLPLGELLLTAQRGGVIEGNSFLIIFLTI
jgi:hypothetical protein